MEERKIVLVEEGARIGFKHNEGLEVEIAHALRALVVVVWNASQASCWRTDAGGAGEGALNASSGLRGCWSQRSGLVQQIPPTAGEARRKTEAKLASSGARGTSIVAGQVLRSATSSAGTGTAGQASDTAGATRDTSLAAASAIA